jgi:hypothetical protein
MEKENLEGRCIEGMELENNAEIFANFVFLQNVDL